MKESDLRLAPHHLESLQRSAISLEVIEQRGYWTATTPSQLAELGYAPVQQRVPALVIPTYDINGERSGTRIRPDVPRNDQKRGKGVKYDGPTGSGNVLDIPPSVRHHVQDPSVPLWVTEGIKKADALASQGEAVIGLLGVWNWKDKVAPLTDWDRIPLNGRTVRILFDSDGVSNESVCNAGLKLRDYLRSKGAHTSLYFVPAGPDATKQGVDDFLASEGTMTELESLANVETRKHEDKPNYLAALQTELNTTGGELWRDDRRTGYATYRSGTSWMTSEVTSSDFRMYVGGVLYHKFGKAVASHTVADLTNALNAEAIHGKTSAQYATALRYTVAPNAGRLSVCIDLGDDEGTVLRIEAMHDDGNPAYSLDSWRDCPVRFRRTSSQRALPKPEFTGPVPSLGAFINMRPEDEPLFWGFLVGCFTPRGGIPILYMTAMSGSGKSVAVKRLRSLVDPSVASSRQLRRADEMPALVANNAVLVLDNHSHLIPQISDLLCQVATGGGFSTRRLYTNNEEALTVGRRPVILCGITDFIEKPDLRSRCITVELPQIVGVRAEADLDEAFDAARPRLFGELITRLSRAIRDHRSQEVGSFRMADMARWVQGSEPEDTRGAFVAAYREAIEGSGTETLDTDPVAIEIVKLVRSKGPLHASAGEILERMKQRMGSEKLPRDYPDNAKKLGKALAELAPEFQRAGWQFRRDRKSKRRSWIIEAPVSLPFHDDVLPLDHDVTMTSGSGANVINESAPKTGSSNLNTTVTGAGSHPHDMSDVSCALSVWE